MRCSVGNLKARRNESTLVSVAGDCQKHALQSRVWSFLGAFAKLQKATSSFVMSVRSPLFPHERTQLLLDGMSCNSIFEYFTEVCQHGWRFFKI